MIDKNKTAAALNKLCCKCVRSCRQSEAVLLVDCPRYKARPFKSEELEFTQLDLFGDSAGDD